MKILWNSIAPWVGTGYGNQTRLFTSRIRDLGHDVAIATYSVFSGKVLYDGWEGMTVYPADHTGTNKYMLRKYVEMHAAQGEPCDPDDVQVITLTDVWPFISAKHGGHADWRGLKIASWTPVDHDPCPLPVAHALQTFNIRPIAMSKFGEDRLQKAGLDPLYVPHGIDTKALRPYEDRDALRDELGWPRDAFVVGMVANNRGQEVSRKCFPQIFNAFAIFRDKHPDAILYLHTDVFGFNEGLNLLAMARDYRIPDDAIRAVNQDMLYLNEIGHEEMGRFYAGMDVLINTSMGEGFGVPIVEAQACGTPVIVTNWTAMPELVGAGWVVEGDPWRNSAQASWWKVPSIDDIVAALELAYEARGDTKIRFNARAFALQYDADLVTEDYWKPVLEALDKPREVPPLVPLNRAQRRAAEKAKAA